MRRIHLLISALVVIAIVQPAGAWNGSNHEDIADHAFQALSENTRTLLLSSMISDGSKWPDWYRTTMDSENRMFPSTLHIQPTSRNSAKTWLSMAENYFRENDYSNASLSLGIAAHFISDSVVPLHNIGWNDLHETFESAAEEFTPAEPKGLDNFDLEQCLVRYNENAQAYWDAWENARDPGVIQYSLDLASYYVYNAWCDALGVAPSNYGTEPTLQLQGAVSTPTDNTSIIIVVAVVIMAIAAFFGTGRLRNRKSVAFAPLPQPSPQNLPGKQDDF